MDCVDPDVIEVVRRYLAALPAVGINPVKAILYGSQARGDVGEWSDIDVVVIAPEFDTFRPIPLKLATKFWTVAVKIDSRLDVVPCGVEEWSKPHGRPVLSYADGEGVEVHV